MLTTGVAAFLAAAGLPTAAADVLPPVRAVAIDVVPGSTATGDGAPSAIPDDIVVTARTSTGVDDPAGRLNAKTFAVAQSIDEAVVGPVALAYRDVVPEPARDGLRNVLYNLQEPTVFVNFLIQLKPGKAAETLGRFSVNTVLGLAGLFDVARRPPFGLPRRRNGFADSMGYYGVKPGAFLFLPLIGPTTVRDALGGVLDRLVLPLAVGAPFNRIAFTASAGIVSALNRRVAFDDDLRTLRDAANPYVARRDRYLRDRQAEIDGLRGRPAPR